VDSAAAAILLQKQGYTVTGLYLDTGCGDPADAKQAAEALGIDFAVQDIRQALEARVIEPFVQAYLHGQTPNPCIFCNPQVKFRTLIDYADRVGAGYIATGHYARCEDGVLMASPSVKDQSYMLYRLPREILERTIFPLGSFESKEQVRALVSGIDLHLGQKQDSMEICFIPDNDYAGFIEQRGTVPPPGLFVDEQGKVLGMHKGIHHYTVGMRRGLGIALGHRAYVSRIEPDSGRIVISDAAIPNTAVLTAEDARWLRKPEIGQCIQVRIRHSRTVYSAVVTALEGTDFSLKAEGIRFASPGQSAVLYDADIVLGGGYITNCHHISP